jgi:hypothetical protein
MSPSYLLIPLLVLVGLFPYTQFHRKQIIIIALIWAVIFSFFYQQIINYILVYKDFSDFYDVAFSTPASSLTPFTLGASLTILIVVSMVVMSIATDGDDMWVRTLAALPRAPATWDDGVDVALLCHLLFLVLQVRENHRLENVPDQVLLVVKLHLTERRIRLSHVRSTRKLCGHAPPCGGGTQRRTGLGKALKKASL